MAGSPLQSHAAPKGRAPALASSPPAAVARPAGSPPHSLTHLRVDGGGGGLDRSQVGAHGAGVVGLRLGGWVRGLVEG